jgi:alpha-soluble NSF attachment protein
MAARSLRDVAETMEKGGLKEEAIEFFTQAGDLYAGEEQPSEANKCKLRVAALSAEVERYAPAAAIFEEVGSAAVENPLLKYGAKGHFLNAGICTLAQYGGDDPAAVGAALERYETADVSMAGSREGNLLRDLAGAAAARDPDAFTSALAEFDSMTRLDAWKTALLLRVKKRIAGGAAEGGEEDLT